MEVKDWIEFISAVLAGMATAIPLIYQLGKAIRQIIKEKNWNKIVSELLRLMEIAEGLYEDGASKKQWVMTGIQEFAKSINYDLDMVAIGKMIDEFCNMSKIVNPPLPVKPVTE